MKKKKVLKRKLNPVEREIIRRESIVASSQRKIKKILSTTREEIDTLEEGIRAQQEILDALKR